VLKKGQFYHFELFYNLWKVAIKGSILPTPIKG